LRPAAPRRQISPGQNIGPDQQKRTRIIVNFALCFTGSKQVCFSSVFVALSMAIDIFDDLADPTKGVQNHAQDHLM
jgi:hypothetical protein